MEAALAVAANDQDLQRLESNIREELAAQSALRGLGLDESTLDGLGLTPRLSER